jgi:hypothetical protein
MKREKICDISKMLGKISKWSLVVLGGVTAKDIIINLQTNANALFGFWNFGIEEFQKQPPETQFFIIQMHSLIVIGILFFIGYVFFKKFNCKERIRDGGG